jgi:hypothetical protein
MPWADTRTTGLPTPRECYYFRDDVKAGMRAIVETLPDGITPEARAQARREAEAELERAEAKWQQDVTADVAERLLRDLDNMRARRSAQPTI